MHDSTDIEPLLTIKEACKILKISDKLLYAYINREIGPKIIRFGSLIRIKKSALLEWMEKNHPPLFHQ